MSAPADGSCSTGANNATLPAGSTAIAKNGTTYYLGGHTWFTPAFGRTASTIAQS